MTVDVLTFGEGLLRLTPPAYQLMEQTHMLESHVGGSELNTAIGLTRLGKRVAWFSRMTDNVVGRRIEQELLKHGVDAGHIIWTDEARNGLYFMEEAPPPRASDVTYDRAHTAISQMKPGHLKPDMMAQLSPRLLHLTGITAALSESSYETLRALVKQAQEQQIPVSFDVNYRAKLWPEATAASYCDDLMKQAAIIFVAQRDVKQLFAIGDIQALHNAYPNAHIVVTRGADGSQLCTPDGVNYDQSIFQATTVCRIGGGDAFSAGFLYAYLEGLPPQEMLRYAAATAALKYTIPGDLPLFRLEDVQTLLRDGISVSVKR